ncbi:hypothetical protein FB451DRAFT_1181181 [Mycena latifolia]|nr:hypothetical protein FB451DRAFT_1181181 [Mycena latifolia]
MARERAVDASRSTDEKSDSTSTTPHAPSAGAPRESAGWCALCAPSGGGIRAVFGRACREPRIHTLAGYAARASRAEAALPSSHSRGSGSARQVAASCARSPSSPAHLVQTIHHLAGISGLKEAVPRLAQVYMSDSAGTQRVGTV